MHFRRLTATESRREHDDYDRQGDKSKDDDREDTNDLEVGAKPTQALIQFPGIHTVQTI